MTKFITDMSQHSNEKIIEFNTLSNSRRVARKVRRNIDKKSEQHKQKLLYASKAEWKKTVKKIKTYFDKNMMIKLVKHL